MKKVSLKLKIAVAVILTAAAFIAILRLTASPILSDVVFSTAVYDRNGKLLRLTLAADGIYRVHTPLDNISAKFIDATLLYEDRWFYRHLGVNPVALARGAVSLIKKDPRPLGASTITMQLARIKFNIDSKSIPGKIYQILCAFYLEACYSKNEILEAYFNLAPYGHNIEGISAASLIYFGVQPSKLSSFESVTLAVIPQNPSGRTPTKKEGMDRVIEARKRLLPSWLEKYPEDKNIEPLLNMSTYVSGTVDLPFRAPHFVNNIIKAGNLGNIDTTLDLDYQNILEKSINSYITRNSVYGVKNAAALLINIETSDILAYVGSGDFFNGDIYGQVDGAAAYRSPGSAMKPFIFGLAIDQGLIHPKSMMKDAPKRYGAYSPENSDGGFMGPIFASDALVNSRNIPAIDLLNRLDNSTFYNLLKSAGIKGLRSESFYGSALALGGFEMSMLDLGVFYNGLANFGAVSPINFIKDGKMAHGRQFRLFSEEAAYLVDYMLAGNPKPEGYEQVGRVSWKTGTSFAFKDAWTAGIFGKYVLITWVGNFNGDGNPIFTGRGAAAKIFFSIVNNIKSSRNETLGTRIPPKILHIKDVDICSPTGDLAGKLCPQVEKGKFIPGVSPIKVSDIFREVAIDKATGLRACVYEPETSYLKVYEFWPSDLYDLFLKSGIRKKLPPPYVPGCDIEEKDSFSKAPVITSPTGAADYYVSKYEIGEKEIGFTATADAGAKKLFWFLNGRLEGESAPGTPLFWKVQPGKHKITVTDDGGKSDTLIFNVSLH